MDKRIYGSRFDIDYDKTLSFFENRGSNKELRHKYNYVLFQDDAPELAVERDQYEKEKISSLLTWKSENVVLDIGCGIGRWGEEVLKRSLTYIGIDFSRGQLEIAGENLKPYGGKAVLIQDSFQNSKPSLLNNTQYKAVDKVFINGVMMYVNDNDLEKGLVDIYSICSSECEIYIKESMAIETRLTLNEFYSESLTQDYTVIYRSIEEYKKLLDKAFIKKGFRVVSEGYLFDEELRNRKETADYYIILKKQGV